MDEDLTIRPERSARMVVLVGLVVVIVLFILFTVVVIRAPRVAAAIGAPLLIVSAVIVSRVLALTGSRDGRTGPFNRASLAVSDEVIRCRNALGRSMTCDRASLARVVEARLVIAHTGPTPATWLVFLDHDGRAAMRAYAGHYSQAQLADFRERTGLPWERDEASKTFAEMRREIPESFPWTLAHLWLTTMLLGLALVVLALTPLLIVVFPHL